MKRTAIAFTVVAILALAPIAAQNRSVDTAFQKFWTATSPSEADKALSDVLKSGVTFDEALRRLKAGRTYSAQKSGAIMLANRTKDGIEHHYAVNSHHPEHYEAGIAGMSLFDLIEMLVDWKAASERMRFTMLARPLRRWAVRKCSRPMRLKKAS